MGGVSDNTDRSDRSDRADRADAGPVELREQVEQVRVELRRVTDRLRTLGPDRLIRPGGDGTTPGQHARRAAQELADLAADLEGGPRRTLPELAPGSAADLLAVPASDVLTAAAAAPQDPATADGLRAANDALTRLRRQLP